MQLGAREVAWWAKRLYNCEEGPKWEAQNPGKAVNQRSWGEGSWEVGQSPGKTTGQQALCVYSEQLRDPHLNARHGHPKLLISTCTHDMGMFPLTINT